jgi:lipoprotein-anchoring transpeptidase ErfK/SrfK
LAKRVELIPNRADHRGLRATRALLATGAAVTLLAAWATSSEAAQRRSWSQDSFWGSSSPTRNFVARRARNVTTASVRQAPKADPGFGEMPKGPLQIVVSIGSQKVTLYSNGVRVAQGGVSTGQAGHLTPMGVFSVIEKDRYHHSNIYSGAPMPFMQRITWSGIALHEGVLPGYPASHGCIRMSHEFAQKLWPVTKLGVRVIVARTDVTPSDFQHAKLFAPKPKPAPEQVAIEDEAIKLVHVAQAMKDGVTVLDVTPAPVDEGAPVKPAATAQAPDELGVGAATVPATPKATESAEPVQLGINGQRPDDAAQATGTIAPSQGTESTAPGAPSELRRSVEAPETPATSEQNPAQAMPASGEPNKPAPVGAEPAKPPARMKAADQPQKRYGQVAVFVSRKEKKIFIRQGFAPLFEMPITIDEPDRPLGTHVFTAMGFTDDGAGMRWNLMTVPNELSHVGSENTSRHNRRQQAEAVKPVVSGKPASSAAEALDRIQFPQEALDRIGELLIPGSSLVVSDEGLGRETGRGTEFVVLTR